MFRELDIIRMVNDQIPMRTIVAFINIRAFMVALDGRQFTSSEMAAICGITPPAISRHVKTLTNRGYLRRVHYRAWELV